MKYIRLSVITALCVLVHSLINPDSTTSDKNNATQQYDKIILDWSRTWAEVMQFVKERHYKPEKPDESISKAIDTFLNTLDPHSGFLDPKTYKMMLETTSGEFHGIGIVIDNTRKTKDKHLTVVDVIHQGPSYKAGLQQYDRIIEIDGKALEGMTTEQATSLLRGQKGSNVCLKVIREGMNDLLSFTITRDVVREQSSLSFYIKEYNIYYLALTTFSENAVRQIEELLKKSKSSDYRSIILDLRNNSGGLLQSAIEIAGLFLKKNSLLVTTKDRHNNVTETYHTTRSPIANNKIPIFVLTNNYTASAAEILAGCLKVYSDKDSDNVPVFTVGTTTFGKGSVQEVIPVSNNSAIKLTTSLYFLPDDTTIQGIGIAPDFYVERCLQPTEQMQWFTKFYGRENTLDNYIKVDKESKTPDHDDRNTTCKEKPKRWQERIKDMLHHDNQLKAAITLSNILYNAKTNLAETVKTRQSARNHLKNVYIDGSNLEIEEIAE